MIDTEFLQKSVSARGYKKKHLAQFMNLSFNSLQNKLTGKSHFKLSEAQRLSRLLNMTTDEIRRCFWPDGGKEGRHDV